MATPVNKRETVVGVAPEVTEGTYVAPTTFLLSLPGISINPAREELVRDFLKTGIGEPSPRVGIKSVEASVPLEYKASGTEGGIPEMDILLKAAMGNVRTIAAQNTSKAAGNTASILQIEDADIADYTVGDFLVILESGDHQRVFVTAVDPTGGTANITLTPARAAGAYSASVVISKSRTYHVAQSGHDHVSLTVFHGDEIDERAIGCKVNSFALENYTTGQLANMTFGLDGLDFSRQDGSASSPTFSTGLPPVLLEACIFIDGTVIEVPELSLSLTNEVAEQRDLCSAAGVVAQRIRKRTISGTINPYLDDTAVTRFDLFNDNTEFALLAVASTPSAVAGEISLGSAMGIFLPQCIMTSNVVGDVDELNVESIEFKAVAGTTGTTDEIFIGMV